ncbi:DUF2341 domain-containing protein [Methanolobus sp. ZRKC2]|uniref:DUF2341 domain-containing protein n=1 Tax=Methanolobus sp. ZRKC2 TaxID=3125783 RepID=UPI003244A944
MLQNISVQIKKLLAIFMIIILLAPNAYCFENTETEQDVNAENTQLDSGSNENNDVDFVDKEEETEKDPKSENIINIADSELETSQIEIMSSVSEPIEDPEKIVEGATNLLNPKIENNNDGFDTSLFTGSFVYTYPIETVRGKAGLEPEVSLTYSSSIGSKGTYGSLGMGWSLNANCIYRDTNYTTENTIDDKFYLILDGSTYELVYVADDDSYHTETESFLHITKGITNTNSFGDYWIVKASDGTEYRFGYNDVSEQRNSVASRNYVSKWWLDLVEDVNGNQLQYNYIENPRTGELGSIYLDNITYNDGLSIIDFEFIDKPNAFTLYEYGSKIIEKSLISSIKIKNNGTLLWNYEFEYQNENSKSFLAKITKFGVNNESFPSTEFDYSATGGWGSTSTWNPPALVSYSGSDKGIRAADVNGDGLVDMLRGYEDGSGREYFNTWLNTGNGWQSTSTWNPPVIISDNGIDEGVRLADLNGDGLVDMLRGYEDGNGREYFNTWLNTGSGWQSTSTWNPPVIISDNGIDEGVRFADLNGDGLVDMLRGYENSDNTYFNTWLNTGSGWQSTSTWNPPVTISYRGMDKGVRFADVNGDGLVDMLWGYENTDNDYFNTWLNTGNGWQSTNTWNPQVISYRGRDTGIRFADVNGDGLVDMLRGYEDTDGDQDRTTWLNTGNGWQGSSVFNPPTVFSRSGTGRGVIIADFNGDGLDDFIQKYEDANRDLSGTWINTNRDANPSSVNYKTPYLLSEIHHSTGASTVVNYVPSTKFDNTGDDSIADLPLSMWVTSQLIRNNGISDTGNVVSTTDYTYKNGMQYFNPPEEIEFRGFGEVTVENDYSISKHFFHQDDVLKGIESQTEVWDKNGNIYSLSEMNYTGQQTYPDVNLILLNSESITQFDGLAQSPDSSAGWSSLVEYGEYDDYGNPLSVTDHGDTDIIGDEKYLNYEYANKEDSWIIGKKTHEWLEDSNHVNISEAWYYYDGSSDYSNINKGQLTKIVSWNNMGNNPTILYDYDNYGNIVQVTDAKGSSENIVYDGNYIYPVSLENSIGQKKFYEYNDAGRITKTTDSNGVSTEYSYDDLHRITKVIKPYNNVSSPSIEYIYYQDGIAPEMVLTRIKENNVEEDVYTSGVGNYLVNNTIFSNKKIIIIAPSADGTLTDYQMSFDINYEPEMQSDFDDLRFTDEDGFLIPYWIEEKNNSISSKVWLKVPKIDGTNGAIVKMYYGNLTASSKSNINDVMLFSDTFPGNTIDSNKWIKTVSFSSSISVSDGVYTSTIPYSAIRNKGNVLESTVSFNGPIVVNADYYYAPAIDYPTANGYPYANLYYGTGYSGSQYSKGVTDGWHYDSNQQTDPTNTLVRYFTSGTPETIYSNTNEAMFPSHTWTSMVFKFGDSNVAFYADGTEKFNVPGDFENTNGTLRLAHFTTDKMDGIFKVKNFFVRQYAFSEPTYTIPTIYPSESAFDSFTAYDGFSQPVQTYYEGEKNWITQNTTYNELGLVESTEVPHYFNRAALSITYEYDPIGRPTVITNTDSTTLTYNYDLDNTTITNQNGIAKTLTNDIFGNIVSVYEFNEGETYVTSYSYDAMNNLIGIVSEPCNVCENESPYFIDDEDALSYWIEGVESGDRTFVKVNELLPSETEIYAVQKENGYAPNGNDVFDFFENAQSYTEGTTDPGNWSVDSYSGYNGETSIKAVSSRNSYDFGSRVLEVTGVGSGLGYVNCYVRCKQNINLPQNSYIFESRLNPGYPDYSGKCHAEVWIDDTLMYNDNPCEGSSGACDQWYDISFNFNNSCSDIKLGNHFDSLYSGAVRAAFDDIVIRKHATIEPTIVVEDMGGWYKIFVTNNGDEELTDYQVALPSEDLDIKSTNDSLSIGMIDSYYSDDNSSSYWIEGVDSGDRTFVKVDELLPSETEVYAVQKENGYAPNGNDVFDFFENAQSYTEGTTDPGNWSVDSYSGYNGETSIKAVSSRNSYDFSSRVLEVTGVGSDLGYVNCYVRCKQNVNLPQNTYVFESRLNPGYPDYSGKFHAEVWIDDTLMYNDNPCEGSSGACDQWYDISFNFNNSCSDIKLGNHFDSLYSGAARAAFDDITIRKYASIEPTVVVEDMGGWYKVIVTNGASETLTDYQIAILSADLNISSIEESLYITKMDNFQPGMISESDFSNNQTIIISPSADGTLTDYQMSFDIGYEAGMQSDFDDLRFTDENETLLPYWIEEKTNGISAKVWVKIPVIDGTNGTTIRMYYGNSIISSAENGEDVFEFFDDFDDTSLDTSKWSEYQPSNGACTLSDSVATIDFASAHNTFYAIYTNDEIVLDQYIITAYSKPGTGKHSCLIAFGDETCSLAPHSGLYGVSLYARPSPENNCVFSYNDGSNAGYTFENLNMAYCKYEMVNTGDTVEMYRDGNLLESKTLSLTGTNKLYFSGDQYSSDSKTLVDYVFVRKYVANEPGVTIVPDSTIFDSSSFSNNQTISLSPSSDGTLTDYQMSFDIAYESEMQSDFDDLRFTDENETLLPYWIEEKTNGISAKVWVKVPVIDGTNGTAIKMYYGNSIISSAENGDDVFEFFDDFDGTSLDTSKWSEYQPSNGACTLSDSVATIDFASAHNTFYAIYTNDEIVLDQYIITAYSKPGTGKHSCLIAFGDEACSLAPHSGLYGVSLYARPSPENNCVFSYNDGSNAGYTFENLNTAYCKYEMVSTGDTVEMYRDEDLLESKTLSLTGTNKLYFSGDQYSSDSKTLVDYVFVRKYAADEPTYTISDNNINNNTNNHTNNHIYFTYDSIGRKISMTDLDMGHWTYEYDLNGNLINQTDARGVSTILTYDDLNRVTAIDYPNDEDVSFTYDLEFNGTLSQVTRGNVSSAYDYDLRYRVEDETVTLDSTPYTTSYEYDSMDRPTMITYPNGENVNLTYNAQTLLESVEGVVDNLDYNARNQITTKELSNGVVTSYTYDTEKLLLDRIYTDSLQDLNYNFDNVGNILEIEDNVLNSVKTYGYDDLDRLTSADMSVNSVPTYQRDFTYDQYGCIQQVDENSVTISTYEYNQTPFHAPVSYNGNDLEYDANGNLIEDEDFSYVYNDANQLSEVRYSGNSSLVEKYWYDADGKRVKKQNSAGEFTYYVNKFYEVDNGNATSYFFRDDERIAKETAGDMEWYLSDHLGSTTLLIDESGLEVERTEYYPYGQVQSGGLEKYGFTGQENDADTDLMYYGARYYSPEYRVFVQRIRCCLMCTIHRR